MKPSIITTIILACALSAQGQLPKWVIEPGCDTIFVKAKDILQATSNGENQIWSMGGRKLYTTDKRINDFNNGLATIQDLNTLAGFIDTSGKFIGLPGLEIAHDYPYFEDNYLVAKQNGDYVMYSKFGKPMPLPPLQILYPYENGYAPFFAYQNPEKRKNPYFNLLMSDGDDIKEFVIKDNNKTKEIEPKDITFISAVGSDTGRALAVVKNKLYWFDTFEKCLIPILMGDENEKKRHLTLDSSRPTIFTNLPSDSLTIHAKYCKDQKFDFHFDHLLRLIPNYATAQNSQTSKSFEVPNYSSNLTYYKDGKTVGLIYKACDSIPSQFEKVGIKYGNKALVKHGGKWGLLEIIPDCDYEIQLNDGNDIRFRHQTASSSITVNLPASIDPQGVTIDIPESSGIHIDKTSRESNNSESGNYVTYACTLDIPMELTDTLSEIPYGSVTVYIDKVQLPNRKVKAKGWLMNHYSVDLPEKIISIANGKVVFNIMVNNDKEPGEDDYSLDVALQSDSLPTLTENVSENLYLCTVDSLPTGINNLTINVAEKGCPGFAFPIEIEYSKIRKKETAIVRNKLEKQNAEDSQITETTEDEIIPPVDVQDGDGDSIASGEQAPKETMEPIINISNPRRIIFEDGYFVGEVLSDNANLRTGPGTNYPQSTRYIAGANRETAPAPKKGELIKITEAGDWYMIYQNPNTSKNDDPRYISKKLVKPLESKPFTLDEIKEPTTYVKVTKEYDDIGESGYFAHVVVVYPGGLFVEYYPSFWEDAYYMGTISDGDPALIAKYKFNGTYESNKTKNQAINVDRGLAGAGIYVEIPESNAKSISKNNMKVPYPDLSLFSEEEWRDALQTAMSREDFNEADSNVVDTDLELIMISKDDLEKNYTKMK